MTTAKQILASVLLALLALIGFQATPADEKLGGSIETIKITFADGFDVVNLAGTSMFSVTKDGLLTLASTGTFNLNGTLNSGTTTVDEFTQGGGVVTVTPTGATVTLTQAQLLSANVITFTASTTQAALTVTLPATSTMTTLLASAGDYRSWVIENSFLGSATTTTIAAGTGVDLQEPDGQNVVIGIDNYAFLTCFREASTNVVCRVDETIPAD